ncbi:MAG TPA: hypothetical protein VIG90_04035 [Pedomonas sp.]|uniref:hypothetical protein n=1 Tax=Pedomonas sp. TaxID=2976421 RepID=UPI002F3FC7B9
MTGALLSVGKILEKLTTVSKRPRQTFVILNLISEVAGPDGRAGPWIEIDGKPMAIRDWLGIQLLPLMAKNRARQELRQRLRTTMKDELPPDPEAAEKLIEQVVRERALQTNKTIISRAVTDLEAAGMIKRQYEGYLRPHVNRGAQRHAVYIVNAETRAALQRGTHLL